MAYNISIKQKRVCLRILPPVALTASKAAWRGKSFEITSFTRVRGAGYFFLEKLSIRTSMSPTSMITKVIAVKTAIMDSLIDMASLFTISKKRNTVFSHVLRYLFYY
jgi:hypothetical protein